MGSLTSTPKVPETTSSQPSVVTQVENTQTTETTESTVQEDATQERQRSLLARDRGRLGTIATSLHGFLGESNSGGRKTLLGE